MTLEEQLIIKAATALLAYINDDYMAGYNIIRYKHLYQLDDNFIEEAFVELQNWQNRNFNYLLLRWAKRGWLNVG